MILDHAHSGTIDWQVTIANGKTVTIKGSALETEGGALVIKKPGGQLEVAFGPGAWLEVQRA